MLLCVWSGLLVAFDNPSSRASPLPQGLRKPCGSGLARDEVGSRAEDQPLRTRKLRHNAATINPLTSAQPQACWFCKPS
ncbi:hypothetical protein EI534_25165 [Pseudomonas frederiksbergensis]|nr:hypothetical protein [Pseudomonas frederiksbergensis]